MSRGLDLGRFTEPALLILVSLADGPKHGYAMMADIEAVAGAKLGPGTLYGALARLEHIGLVEPLRSDDRRIPYRLTSRGKAMLREQLGGLRQLAATGTRRLNSA